jgi:uncharacterized protein
MLLKRILQKVLIAGVDLYQWLLRPLLPPSCRFYPSCSEYARQSLIRYGPFKGVIKTILRLLKCHPFHPGGVDLP